MARASIAGAIKVLDTRRLTDKEVHSARKNLKRARAMLRLLRPSIGKRAYHRENGSLRDCARGLSMLRDGRALLDTATLLRARVRSADERSAVRRLAALLEHDHMLARRALTRDRTAIDAMRETLRSSYRRTAHWRPRPGTDRPGRGVRRVYSRGCAAQKRAQAHRTAANLHELRKQTKYLYHQLEALEPLQPGRITRLAERMRQLADLLGDEHNLNVLRARVAHSPLERRDRIRLRRIIDHARAKLDRAALARAHRMYRQPPAVFAALLDRRAPPVRDT
jgi:CHAD domain-containing protein